eukprot:GHVH01007100.1.p1 GENE.GHVH01007100.1~~GHVH01007100.1.p1  ORF type:complete len:183 (-),score=17.20 GHVH01007100.1:3-551(-)
MLCFATLFEVISWATTAMCISSNVSYRHGGDEASKFNSGAMIFTFARLVHIVAMLIYPGNITPISFVTIHSWFCLSGAIFMMEVYHGQGAGEAWAWILSTLYKITALLEVVYLLNSNYFVGLASSIFYVCALGGAFVWSLQFEKVVIENECKMTQCVMQAEIYKSKNAMAYHGSAIETASVA